MCHCSAVPRPSRSGTPNVRSHFACSSSGSPSPAEVARRARAAGVPCLGLAGVVRLTADQLATAGFVAAAGLTDIEPDVTRCLAEPEQIMARLAAEVVPRHVG